MFLIKTCTKTKNVSVYKNILLYTDNVIHKCNFRIKLEKLLEMICKIHIKLRKSISMYYIMIVNKNVYKPE